MTDKKVDLTQLMIAGPMHEGSIEDHVEVARKQVESDNKYRLIHRANFQVDVIPRVHYAYLPGVSMLQDGSDYHRAASESNRGWKTRTVIAEDLDQETAIKTAKEYGLAKNLPVYFKNKFWTVEVIQKPEGWEPHFG